MAKSAPRKQFRKTFIREWRKKAGLTLEQLADRIDMKASALSYLERGQSAYTQGTLEAIADALNTSAASLIMRDPTRDDTVWSVWDEATPAEKMRIIAIAEAVKKTGT